MPLAQPYDHQKCAMLSFIIQRLLLAIVTMWAITVLSFIIIQLPPGDFVDAYVARLSASGSSVSAAEAEGLRQLYGLDQPYYIQYLKWMGRLLKGDFGESMEWQRPVAEVLGDRLWMTVVLSFAALLLTWGLALPIGIYSAVRQYSVGDYVITTLGFIGLAVPNFLLALIILYLSFRWFGSNIGGLFSAEMELAPWGWAKFADLMWHLPLPALILAIAGTAQLIRIMRANLLDELRKPYVVTARAKGLSEMRVIMKYPVRAALNPVRIDAGLPVPLPRLGQHHHQPGDELADGRPGIAERADRPGHVSRRHDRAAAGGAHRRRDVHLGSRPDVDRSAHPPSGGPVMTILATAFGRLLGRTPKAAGAVAEDRIAVATQRQLIWWRFKKHKLAVVSLFIVALFYLVAVFADFLAYTDPEASDSRRGYISPQTITWFDSDGAFRPYVHGLKGVRDMKTFKLVYKIDETRKVYIKFFAEGYPYYLLGFIPANRHLLSFDTSVPGERPVPARHGRAGP